MLEEAELAELQDAIRARIRGELDQIAAELGLRTRVLVVDDDYDSANLIQRFLERRGHPVHIALDLPEAIDAARHFQPDVVVLDVGLPSGNGYDLAPSLREAKPGPLRIVGLSGYDGREYQRRAAAAGFDAYLIKPASLRAVASEVESENGVASGT